MFRIASIKNRIPFAKSPLVSININATISIATVSPVALNVFVLPKVFASCDVIFIITSSNRAMCRCDIRIPSARNHCLAFDKDKYLEPMFGDVGQARTNAAMLLMLIAATSSRICTKPTVGRSFISTYSNKQLYLV